MAYLGFESSKSNLVLGGWVSWRGSVFEKVFLIRKSTYIHQNPVRAGIVEKEEEYLNSSAGDFHGIRKGPIRLAEFG